MPSRPLRELDGEFVKYADRAEKDCLCFICPACARQHSIIVSWKPPSLYPSGAVWKKTGETIDDISFTPSIDCTRPWRDPATGISYKSDCTFHGYITRGIVSW